MSAQTASPSPVNDGMIGTLQEYMFPLSGVSSPVPRSPNTHSKDPPDRTGEKLAIVTFYSGEEYSQVLMDMQYHNLYTCFVRAPST